MKRLLQDYALPGMIIGFAVIYLFQVAFLLHQRWERHGQKVQRRSFHKTLVTGFKAGAIASMGDIVNIYNLHSRERLYALATARPMHREPWPVSWLSRRRRSCPQLAHDSSRAYSTSSPFWVLTLGRAPSLVHIVLYAHLQ